MILKIQDKEYAIKYDINALVFLEELTGKTVSEIFTNQGFGIATLRYLFAAGLKKHHKDLDITAAGDLMQQFLDVQGTLEDFSQLITKAFNEANLVKKTKK